MKMGHVTGNKVEKANSQDWYKAIEEANIQGVEDAARALATALATQVGNAVAAMPEAASRIAKAAAIVQTRQVWPVTDKAFLVASSRDTDKAYLVRRGPWHCDCADYQHRAAVCKHILAVQLTVKLGALYQANYTTPEAA